MPGRIFISYSKADPEPTRALADFLTAQGYTVWWDTNLTSGEVFREVIDRELAAADAVIVIWTAHSVASNWVVSEADDAARRNKLITVRTGDLEPWRIPKPYTAYHTDLAGNHEAVCAAVRRVTGEKLELGVAQTDTHREAAPPQNRAVAPAPPQSQGENKPLHTPETKAMGSEEFTYWVIGWLVGSYIAGRGLQMLFERLGISFYGGALSHSQRNAFASAEIISAPIVLAIGYMIAKQGWSTLSNNWRMVYRVAFVLFVFSEILEIRDMIESWQAK